MTVDNSLSYIDPWNGDQWIPFDTFNSNYELAGGGWENNVYRR
jgi:hypothetical protein